MIIPAGFTRPLLGAALCWLAGTAVGAEPAATAGGQETAKIAELQAQGKQVHIHIPIFSQGLRFAFPLGFVSAYEDSKGFQYIQEFVPKGETVELWSQMLSVMGAQDLAKKNPSLTPVMYADKMAEGFKKDCPTSFSAKGVGTLKLGQHDAYLALMACGTTDYAGVNISESMLLVVIKGDRDFYSLQWAERGKPSSSPLPLNEEIWGKRFRQLDPIELCPADPKAACGGGQ
jgi:hypothetical protein